MTFKETRYWTLLILLFVIYVYYTYCIQSLGLVFIYTYLYYGICFFLFVCLSIKYSIAVTIQRKHGIIFIWRAISSTLISLNTQIKILFLFRRFCFQRKMFFFFQIWDHLSILTVWRFDVIFYKALGKFENKNQKKNEETNKTTYKHYLINISKSLSILKYYLFSALTHTIYRF